MCFITKYQGGEAWLVYYGYRYYSASLGKWLSRDPIAEKGGVNLYGCIGNSPLNKIDRLGLAYGNPPSGPNGPQRTPGACPLCLCVSVSMTPGNNVSNLTTPGPPLPGNPAPATLWLGIQVPYTIKVVGDPKACRCKYKDTGSISGTVGGLAAQRNFDRPEDTHYIDCKDGTDQAGVFAGVDPHGSAAYSFDYNWIGTLTCESSLPFLPPMQASASISGHYKGTATW